ncbi:MAG TPA: SsrA-binding protein SmpB [Longimicrobiales bacterium]|nr:SsrA-binding protein SmpB [Longimicrobiales bacterium]
MSKKTVARNRKALHEYHIIDTYEAGIVLAGPEVKSVRAGKVSLGEAYARIDGNEAYIHGLHISPYDPASRYNVDPVRTRKLLLHRREIRRLIGATQQEGFTLVPLEIYLKDGYVKLALALGRGKKSYDKREAARRRDADREIQRAVRQR